jgi:hypothetical protein
MELQNVLYDPETRCLDNMSLNVKILVKLGITSQDRAGAKTQNMMAMDIRNAVRALEL